MAVTAKPYGAFLLGLGKGEFNLSTASFKVLLTTAAYVPDPDTHVVLTDVTNEVTGPGYTVGGESLPNPVWAYDSANDRAVLSADPVLWAAVTLTAHYAVLYVTTGVASTSRLVGYIDFDEDRTYDNSPLQLTFASGAVRLASV